MKEWLIKYWLEVLFGILSAGVTWVIVKIRKMAKEYAALKAGSLAMLHDRIYTECKRCIAEDEVSVEDMRNIEYLYRAYHALGGNGTGTELYNRAKALDIKED